MKRLEEAEQIALIRWSMLVQVGAYLLSDLLLHYPAGGWRSPVEAARETFGALRIAGSLVGKPDPEWTRWPSHTAADMAPAAWRAPGRREARARCLDDALTAAAVQP